MANKIVRKVSKKTTGKTVDTVADYVDLVSQLVAEYFNRRYKITKKVEDIKHMTIATLMKLKKEFIKSIAQGVLLATGIISLVVGIIMVMAKVIPLEYIFIGYGLIVCMLVVFGLKTA